MSWLKDYGNGRSIEYPDGYDAGTLERLATRAQQRFVAMQIGVWGNHDGTIISSDMARMVLIEAEKTAVRHDLELINELAKYVKLTDLPEDLVKRVVMYASRSMIDESRISEES